MEIIKPEKKYLDSYYQACKETWGHVHDNYIIHNPEKYDEWKNTIFEEYENKAKGINLPDGFVASETFWVVEGDEYIGTINIRRSLSDNLREYGGHAGLVIRYTRRKMGYGRKIVEMMLEKIHHMGVGEILLTCEETNIGSQKILEKLKPVRVEKADVMLNNRLTPIKRYYFN